MRLTVLIAAISIGASTGAFAQTVQVYSSEGEAQIACQGTGVVWIIPASKLYVYKGSPHYGKGAGKFLCEPDAIALGAQPLPSHR